MKVWVVTGVSESADHYGPFLFSDKPTQELLKKIAFFCDGYEEEEGPGDFGSYTYLDVNETEVDEMLGRV